MRELAHARTITLCERTNYGQIILNVIAKAAGGRGDRVYLILCYVM